MSARTVSAIASRSLFRAIRPQLCLARIASPAIARGFAVSSQRFAAQQSTLVSTLAEEISFENDQETPDLTFVEEVKKAGIWSIEDSPGSDEVILSRHYNNEKIVISFLASELQADEEDAEIEMNEEDEEPVLESSVPVTVTITKPAMLTDSGALQVSAYVSSAGHFDIHDVAFFQDATLANPTTAEAEIKAEKVYKGPVWNDVDGTLQEEFEAYLSERDVQTIAQQFIVAYCEVKEPKEYLGWLKSMKAFVEQ